MRVVYLHGFASSAQSSKAVWLARALAARGARLETPDLNHPAFGTLTITRMIRQITALIEGTEPVAIIGSSLGAFVAVQVALQRPALVGRLVLLAPALGFGGKVGDMSPGDVDRWKTSDRLDVFHYGQGRVIPVHFELYADARRYDSLGADLPMPVQIFQGRGDTIVDPQVVEAWAAVRPSVQLHMLDDNHQLLASLDAIWRLMEPFLFAGSYQQIP